jgi:hypothetical protein
MTDYSDVPQINMLYSELERTQLAISNINAGATLVSFVIGMPTPTAGLTIIVPIAPTTPPPQQVTITLDAPASDPLMSDLVAWLTGRQDDLAAQLAALGVPNAPTRSSSTKGVKSP